MLKTKYWNGIGHGDGRNGGAGRQVGGLAADANAEARQLAAPCWSSERRPTSTSYP